MTTELTWESALKAADAAVAKRGRGFKYPRSWKTRPGGWRLWERWRRTQCMYVQPDGSGPACLIGEILHGNGAPLEDLALREGRDAGEVILALFPGVDSDLMLWLDRAQERQDTGDPWGTIVDDLHAIGDLPPEADEA